MGTFSGFSQRNGNQDGPCYSPVEVVHRKLPPGAYGVGENNWGNPEYHSISMQAAPDTLNEQQIAISKRIEGFFSEETHRIYAGMGFPHKRGMLLYGPPGTGKSTLLRVAIEMVVRMGGVAFHALDSRISELTAGIQAHNRISPDVNRLVVIEDLDDVVERNEPALLELFDGCRNISRTLFLATTNNKDKLSERMIRASRFDEHVEIGMPSPEERLHFIKRFIKSPELAESMVEDTTRMSMAEIKEHVLQHVIQEKTTAVKKAKAGK